MTEEQFFSKKDPFEESGRPIPPVEGAWSLMRKKLDARLPVALPRVYGHAAWWAGAAVILTTVAVVFWVGRSGTYQANIPAVTGEKVKATSTGVVPDSTKDHVATTDMAHDFAKDRATMTNVGTTGLADSAGKAASIKAGEGHRSFQAGNRPSGGISGEEWTLGRRGRKAQGGSKKSSTTGWPTAAGALGRENAAREQSAGVKSANEQSSEGHSANEHIGGGQLAGGPPPAEQSTLQSSTGRVVSGRVGSAVSRRAMGAVSGPVMRELLVTHDPFCRVADSLLRASAAGGQKAITPASVVAKKKILPAGDKGSRRLLRMAAGISAGKAFPIDGQEANAYGPDGNKAGLTDYIPHLYFRYYPGKNDYVQADVAVHSPQYTHSLVVDSSFEGASNLAGWRGDSQYFALALKKLYYNDLGVSFHYRIFHGLWLGAGIQVSQLLNAVGQNETILLAGGGRDTVFGAQVYGMKSGGGEYNELPKYDYRVTLQAEYSWRRWMLSVIFKDGIQTYTDQFHYGYNSHYRNKSLDVFLSYDLWERKRKK